MVADKTVNVDATVNKNFWAGLLGGEGFVLQKFTGNGLLLAEIDGSVVEIDLKPGQSIKVETGHVALFDASVSYDVESVKGFKNIFFGGQGLFLTTLTGPGKVWLQTLTAQDMAQKLILKGLIFHTGNVRLPGIDEKTFSRMDLLYFAIHAALHGPV